MSQVVRKSKSKRKSKQDKVVLRRVGKAKHIPRTEKTREEIDAARPKGKRNPKDIQDVDVDDMSEREFDEFRNKKTKLHNATGDFLTNIVMDRNGGALPLSDNPRTKEIEDSADRLLKPIIDEMEEIFGETKDTNFRTSEGAETRRFMMMDHLSGQVIDNLRTYEEWNDLRIETKDVRAKLRKMSKFPVFIAEDNEDNAKEDTDEDTDDDSDEVSITDSEDEPIRKVETDTDDDEIGGLSFEDIQRGIAGGSFIPDTDEDEDEFDRQFRGKGFLPIGFYEDLFEIIKEPFSFMRGLNAFKRWEKLGIDKVSEGDDFLVLFEDYFDVRIFSDTFFNINFVGPAKHYQVILHIEDVNDQQKFKELYERFKVSEDDDDTTDSGEDFTEDENERDEVTQLIADIVFNDSFESLIDFLVVKEEFVEYYNGDGNEDGLTVDVDLDVFIARVEVRVDILEEGLFESTDDMFEGDHLMWMVETLKQFIKSEFIDPEDEPDTDTDESSVDLSEDLESDEDTEGAQRQIRIPTEVDREAIDIQERGRAFKIRLAEPEPKVIAIARELPNIDMPNLRKGLKLKGDDLRLFIKGTFIKLRKATLVNASQKDRDAFTDFNNAKSIIVNLVKVRGWIKKAILVNRPVNNTGVINSELVVDEEGYTILFNGDLNHEETEEIIDKINNTSFK